MIHILWVGFGGFIGSMLRYGVTIATAQWTDRGFLPIGTLVVNVLGCLLIGMLSQLSETYGPFSAEIRAFIFVGLLGGFTTFSAFGNETFELWRNTGSWQAVANAAVHIVFGLGAVGLGRSIASKVWG